MSAQPPQPAAAIRNSAVWAGRGAAATGATTRAPPNARGTRAFGGRRSAARVGNPASAARARPRPGAGRHSLHVMFRALSVAAAGAAAAYALVNRQQSASLRAERKAAMTVRRRAAAPQRRSAVAPQRRWAAEHLRRASATSVCDEHLR